MDILLVPEWSVVRNSTRQIRSLIKHSLIYYIFCINIQPRSHRFMSILWWFIVTRAEITLTRDMLICLRHCRDLFTYRTVANIRTVKRKPMIYPRPTWQTTACSKQNEVVVSFTSFSPTESLCSITTGLSPTCCSLAVIVRDEEESVSLVGSSLFSTLGGPQDKSFLICSPVQLLYPVLIPDTHSV